ncbi:hypothetical protein COV06_03890 [Candidatus Uhrbacteria bacterium CG10_big_fil_rev_8_21_14_0_10_50_16]|uniref:Glycosyltransferase 2-like domain-containing protein n=1 Tax=Candidatus Uhrbacteria bacterium CG10_big_fil_rev_8_21_14_0_10_50_16 TaxID=1975039 RepID=A0A2H0RN26_9BACT|nr:MAG: hypothetical protein COV06_03890 [Candidatus Uhrbacteria bacterium CG10_big_fil_rev_8_21_14_0_10_50_16]
MPTQTVDIAIVMVTYNGIHPECLSTLRIAMQHTRHSTALIVVDNASSDFDAYAYVKNQIPEAHVVLRNHNSGFGRASNRGASEVHARSYFFLNPDTKLMDVRVLDTLSDVLQAHPQVGIAAPRVRYMDGSHQQTARRFPEWYMPFVQRTRFANTQQGQRYRDQFLLQGVDPDKRRLVDWVQGSAFLIDGALFREIGGFDDRYFMYFEDVDLCRACWDKGRAVYYVPEAEVHHVYGQGSAKEKTVAKNLFQNKLARVHVDSWVKYLLKWGTRRL